MHGQRSPSGLLVGLDMPSKWNRYDLPICNVGGFSDLGRHKNQDFGWSIANSNDLRFPRCKNVEI